MQLIRSLILSTLVAFSSLGHAKMSDCEGALSSSFRRLKSIFVNGTQMDRLTRLNGSATISTTGLRREAKMVVSQNDFESVFADFTERAGAALKLRDVPEEGTRNLTDTLYATPLSFDVDGARSP